MTPLEQILLQTGFAEVYPRTLVERFPRIAEQIVQGWGRPVLDDYLADLLIMDKHDREGFPPEVAAELMKLSHAHETYLGKMREEGAWDAEPEENGEHRIDFSPRGGGQAAHDAIREGNLGSLILSLEQNSQHLEFRDEHGWTPLVQAAFSGRLDAAGTLLERGANIHAGDRDGYQPVHWAALQGQTAVLLLLLDYGANPNARSNKGVTPLMLAASRGQENAIMLLMQSGASVEALSSEGWCALHKAAANGQTSTVVRLLNYGADPLQPTADGKLALNLVPEENVRLLTLLDEACWRREQELQALQTPAGGITPAPAPGNWH
ncbi:ankyrin repeat domain-containing protein [Chitinilyticum piscinae]|uniref:Ankyrin repeat domain-containing protein n=1 Tax=Chitinilyticum piscinae TaxID=2866724 RepID=A0A8J7FHP3_9NEIS|nr:ankyrin repeat domain-containing protein [Chitinilyticum piscinae]MBE9608400.1 ankyrin repeat domain-containing protein [Chitinilyticum piscinae]